MSTAEKITYLSPEAYLTYEDAIEGKAEYYDGRIVDVAGGSENHSLVVANMIIGIGSRLKGRPCRVYDGNFKLELAENSKYIYPDLLVICGQTQKSKLRDDICTNPTVTVEVLSDSTRSRDQGIKHFHYRMMPSLREFITVEQDRPLVFVHHRNDEALWFSDAYASLQDEVKLYSLDISLPMSEIYVNVIFPPDPDSEEITVSTT